MHDLIFAVAFVAMVTTPAMVAAIGGRKEYNPEPAAPSIRSALPTRSMDVRPGMRAATVRPTATSVRVATTIRPYSATIRKTAGLHPGLVTVDGPTLPMHNARGMSGR
jgi:hypothetical protein